MLEASARTGTMLEINANPDRRDLNELHARDAAAAGIRIVINCDAHRTSGFEVVRYGVATARRAWLSAGQIANTRPWSEVAPLLSRAAGGLAKNWIRANQIRPPTVPISATQKFRRIPRM